MAAARRRVPMHQISQQGRSLDQISRVTLRCSRIPASVGGEMSGKSRRLTALIMLTLMAIGASAQKNELAAGGGRSVIPDQAIQPGPIHLADNSVRFGNGTTWEVNYARHLLNHDFFALDAEVPVVGTPDQHLTSGNGAVPHTYASIFLTPAARVRFFPQNVFQLWISGGGGLGHWTISNTLVSGGINPGPNQEWSGCPRRCWFGRATVEALRLPSGGA